MTFRNMSNHDLHHVIVWSWPGLGQPGPLDATKMNICNFGKIVFQQVTNVFGLRLWSAGVTGSFPRWGPMPFRHAKVVMRRWNRKKGGQRYFTSLGQFSLIVHLKHFGATCHLQSLFCIFEKKTPPFIPTQATESATQQQNKNWPVGFKWRFQASLYVFTKASQEDRRDWLLVDVKPSNDSIRNSEAFALSRARKGCHARLLQEEGRGERICQGSIWLKHETGCVFKLSQNWPTN